MRSQTAENSNKISANTKFLNNLDKAATFIEEFDFKNAEFGFLNDGLAFVRINEKQTSITAFLPRDPNESWIRIRLPGFQYELFRYLDDESSSSANLIEARDLIFQILEDKIIHVLQGFLSEMCKSISDVEKFEEKLETLDIENDYPQLILPYNELLAEELGLPENVTFVFDPELLRPEVVRAFQGFITENNWWASDQNQFLGKFGELLLSVEKLTGTKGGYRERFEQYQVDVSFSYLSVSTEGAIGMGLYYTLLDNYNRGVITKEVPEDAKKLVGAYDDDYGDDDSQYT